MQILKSGIKYLLNFRKSIWQWFDAFNDDRLYVLSATDVIQKYLDYKVDDIEEFATIYTYEFHDIRNKLDDMQSKEEMFKEICETLSDLKRQGLLDR